LGDKVRMMYTNKEFTVTEIGYMKPGGLVPALSFLPVKWVILRPALKM